MNVFVGVIHLLGEVLNIRSARHEVLAANIANADTPGYRAVDLVFEEELKKAARSDGEKGMTQTHPKHFSNRQSANPIPGRVEPTGPTSIRMDGNSVDVERQMVKLAENSLMYEAAVQMLTKKFRGLKEVIREGR